jgi:hypothetical protein
MKTLLGFLMAVVALVGRADAQVGQRAPELDGSKWYNTAPLTLEDLAGKAVHVVVFRTW